ncbi:hypothetical protein Shyhy02_74220 [Streptomyces hygroscopicus subsp. hygroscopicus]|nr:hypothetical protein Shyhy02_74220 [Streptomyces hygroscopicus subsp. hygroscopicus]
MPENSVRGAGSAPGTAPGRPRAALQPPAAVPERPRSGARTAPATAPSRNRSRTQPRPGTGGAHSPDPVHSTNSPRSAAFASNSSNRA